MMGGKVEKGPVVASVILLAYMQKDTVVRAMESLLAQKCRYQWEILVADDGSSDGTREVCEDYALRYPDLIRMLPKAPNKGLVDNYFDAVQSAAGKYVADCAGDDEWLDPCRLERQIEAVESDPSLSAVCCDVEIYDSHSGLTEINRGSVFGDAGESEPCRVSGGVVLRGALNCVRGLPFILSGALFRKEGIIRMLKEEPEILRCHDGGVEDIPLICALARFGDVLHLPFVGYRYHVEGESLSNNLPYEKDYWFCAGVSSMVRRLGKHYGLSPENQRDFFEAKFRYMAWLARMSGNKELRSDFLQRAREWNLPIPFKSRIQLLLLWLHPGKGGKGGK